MKRLFLYMIGVLMLLSACSSPKEIPDEKMADIIHDLLILNSYNSLYQRNYGTDTVDIYQPVLDRYGYDAEDFRYSLKKLALRKSSRLSEIIDMATLSIQKENEFFIALKQEKSRLDSLISDRYKDTVYRQDTALIRVTSLNNKDRLKLRVPAREGEYAVHYNYLIDSADQNSYYMMRLNMINDPEEFAFRDSRTLTKGVREHISLSATADKKNKALEVVLSDYFANAKTPSITVDSVYIIYYEPIETSRKRIIREMLNFDSDNHIPYKHELTPKDSSALRTVPPYRIDTTRRSDL